MLGAGIAADSASLASFTCIGRCGSVQILWSRMIRSMSWMRRW